jgi:hypothetical protein
MILEGSQATESIHLRWLVILVRLNLDILVRGYYVYRYMLVVLLLLPWWTQGWLLLIWLLLLLLLLIEELRCLEALIYLRAFLPLYHVGLSSLVNLRFSLFNRLILYCMRHRQRFRLLHFIEGIIEHWLILLKHI